MQLRQNTHDCHRPRIGRLEHQTFGSRFHDFGHERNNEHDFVSTPMVSFKKEASHVQISLKNGFVFGNGHHSKPLSQVFEEHPVTEVVTGHFLWGQKYL